MKQSLLRQCRAVDAEIAHRQEKSFVCDELSGKTLDLVSCRHDPEDRECLDCNKRSECIHSTENIMTTHDIVCTTDFWRRKYNLYDVHTDKPRPRAKTLAEAEALV